MFVAACAQRYRKHVKLNAYNHTNKYIYLFIKIQKPFVVFIDMIGKCFSYLGFIGVKNRKNHHSLCRNESFILC